MLDVKPNYTAGGIVYNEPTNKKGKGWSKEGIARFNELYGLVVKDWQEYPDCLRDFVNTERQLLIQPEHVRAAPAKAADIYQAVQDEFSDDEDSECPEYEQDEEQGNTTHV